MGIFGTKIKNRTLESVRYSFGGDMLGSYSSAELKLAGDGKATLVFESKKYHAGRMETTTYEVPAQELENVKALMLEYDQYAGSKRPRSKIQVMDAGTGTLSFDFTDGSDFSLSTDLDLTRKQSEGFAKIREYIYSLAKDRDPVSYVKEERQMSVSVNGYLEFFFIRDGVTEEDLELIGGEHQVNSYGDNGKAFSLEQKLDFSGLTELVTGGKPVTLAYSQPEDLVIIFYGDFQPMPGLYELGSMEKAYTTTLDLLAGMEGTYNFFVYRDEF